MRADRIIETFDVELRLTQFPLHPDTPSEGRALTDLFAGRGVDLAAYQARVVQIAGSVGLSEEEALRVLERRTHRGRVDEDWERSAQLGVTSVPTFVFGNRGVVGAQPYEALEELVVRGGGQRRT